VDQTIASWHARFQQQAEWTQSLRQYIFSRLDLANARRILETGCGTGVISSQLSGYAQASVFGLDFNLTYLRFAHQHDPLSSYTAANALQIPFPDGVFDAVVCHFFLLWINQPVRVLAEMTRVCRPGGYVLALAEPDYGGRIDFPPALADLGVMQASALQKQGADPLAGRKLAGWFHSAGLTGIETGVLGGQWTGALSETSWQSEWQTLESDLAGQISPQRFEDLRQADQQAWSDGSRVLFVPTFYAVGKNDKREKERRDLKT